MNKRYAALIFAVAFIVQATVLRYAAVQGQSPNLLLCLAVIFAFLYEKPYGLVLGAVSGVLWDMEFGTVTGVSGISFMAAALSAAWLKQYLNHEFLLPALLGGLLGSVLNSAVFWGLYKLTGAPHTWAYILGIQPVLIGYNLVLTLILQLIFRRGVIRHRKDKDFKGGFREARGFIKL
ncbi:MAG: rod shape-determining protein MreD [Clostridiales Family XIII bacterium]|jgi:rod shape-determining protein MreD|nr:rod shape-determining protein MreD [Clostridiales Family XIII bacterium]